VNDTPTPITNLTMYLPARCRSNGPSDGWHAYVFSTLPDMGGCTQMTTSLLAVFKKDHLQYRAMGGAAIAFRDVNGRYWTRQVNGQLLSEPKLKRTAGLVPIPANLTKAPGC
jgi:hypothetical protein